MSIIPVIISGGFGSRLWPLSREARPKAFITMPNGGTLIGHTYERAARLDGAERIITVTNRNLLFLTMDVYSGTKTPPVENTFILEPITRNTAAAVALAAIHTIEAYGPAAIMLVLPSDHIVEDQSAFAEAARRAAELAEEGRIVTFGIRPERPETGYGYIEADGESVVRFVEKPDVERARQYVASGRFLWNSGMLCFPAGAMHEAMERFAPDILLSARESIASSQTRSDGEATTIEVHEASFAATPPISIDHAVMEKMSGLACVPLSCGWSDVGSWSVITDFFPSDEDGNRIAGEAILHGARNCFVHSRDRLVSLVGVEDLLVIDTADALLITNKSHAQQVGTVCTKLREKGHEAAKQHRTTHRPWGSYTVLQESDRFKIKRIEVKPGARLSLQAHHHRSEHWVVVEGTARVVNGEDEFLLTTNQSTYIECGRKHRLENPGIVPLVLIEVQNGSYLGEDDIVRFDDIYGRA